MSRKSLIHKRNIASAPIDGSRQRKASPVAINSSRLSMQSNHRLFLVWSPQYELGIPIIDEQHRGVVSLLNSLFYYISNPSRKALIMPLLKTCKRYIELHFITEEGVLSNTGYPDWQAHKATHRKIYAKLQAALHNIMRGGNYDNAPEEFLYLMKTLWIEHSNIADQAFAPYVRKVLGHVKP